MSRSALKYGLTPFLLTTATSAAAQDKPTLEIVWPKANSAIAPGDDKRCGHVHMKIDPDGDTCNIPGRPYNSMNSDFRSNRHPSGR